MTLWPSQPPICIQSFKQYLGGLNKIATHDQYSFFLFILCPLKSVAISSDFLFLPVPVFWLGYPAVSAADAPRAIQFRLVWGARKNGERERVVKLTSKNNELPTAHDFHNKTGARGTPFETAWSFEAKLLFRRQALFTSCSPLASLTYIPQGGGEAVWCMLPLIAASTSACVVWGDENMGQTAIIVCVYQMSYHVATFHTRHSWPDSGHSWLRCIPRALSMQLRSNYVHEDLKGPLPVINEYGWHI